MQQAVKEARRKLGVMILPHELRHAYATHCLERGVNLKALKEAMGHRQIETTIGYCHADALSVPSPLEQWHFRPEITQTSGFFIARDPPKLVFVLSRKELARMIGESVNVIRRNEQRLGLSQAKIQINARLVRYNETRARAALKSRGILA